MMSSIRSQGSEDWMSQLQGMLVKEKDKVLDALMRQEDF